MFNQCRRLFLVRRKRASVVGAELICTTGIRLGPLTDNFWTFLACFQLSSLGRNFRLKTDEKCFCPEFLYFCPIRFDRFRRYFYVRKDFFLFSRHTPSHHSPLTICTICSEFTIVEPRIWHMSSPSPTILIDFTYFGLGALFS